MSRPKHHFLNEAQFMDFMLYGNYFTYEHDGISDYIPALSVKVESNGSLIVMSDEQDVSETSVDR